jgi:hypothetical protein
VFTYNECSPKKYPVKAKMRQYILVVCLVASAIADVQITTPNGYHQDIGIPLAAKIKKAEEELFNSKEFADRNRIIGGTLAEQNSHPYLVSTNLFISVK